MGCAGVPYDTTVNITSSTLYPGNVLTYILLCARRCRLCVLENTIFCQFNLRFLNPLSSILKVSGLKLARLHEAEAAGTTHTATGGRDASNCLGFSLGVTRKVRSDFCCCVWLYRQGSRLTWGAEEGLYNIQQPGIYQAVRRCVGESKRYLLHETSLKVPCPERKPVSASCLTSDSSLMSAEQTENIASPSASLKSRTNGRGWRFERHVCKRIRDRIAEVLSAEDAWEKSATEF
jgi:hypothetical protein